MILRRLVALLALLLVALSSVESVVGVLRDGLVHHETGLAALGHTGAGGDHGHEDGPLQHQHGERHQHGTPADHCTHQHGVAQTAPAFAYALPTLASAPSFREPSHLAGRISIPLFHPPRA